MKTRVWLRYVVAAAGVLVATLVRWLFDPSLGDQVAFGIYLVAAILIAWHCGFGPATMALLAGWWCGNFFFSSPRYSWYPHIDNFPSAATTVVYFAIGSLGVFFCQKARNTRDQSISQAVEKAHSESEQLAAVVRSSDDAIITKDLDSIITSWNSAAERLFGYTAAEAIGRSITLLMPPDRTNEEPEILSRIRRGEVIDHYETVRRRKDGSLMTISLTVSPLRDPRGRIVGASKIVRDITATKASQVALQESEKQARSALAKAESASRTKDEFLAILSHELRTPMTAILGWARLLKDGMTPEETRQGIDVIERNARLQAQIIEDLLDMSRIVSGKLRLDVQTLNVGLLVTAAVDSVKVASEAKEIKIALACDQRAGEIRGDPNRLQQVFFNLLTNAVKFTPRGGRIEVSCRPAGSQIEIKVSDTGKGIKPEFLPHVFERFRQQDTKTTRQHQGLGLGLAIVRSLVELHGGSVQASSDGEGKGATFTVQLPVSAVLAAPPSPSWDEAGDGDRQLEASAPDEPSQQVPELAGVVVMVTDDEPDARELLKTLLERRGAKVLVCGSATDALDRLQRHRPDVLVCDIGMPGIDGYGLISRIRSSTPERGGAIPAIALTAFARSEDRTRSLLAGFQMHLSKPVEPAELVASIRSLAIS